MSDENTTIQSKICFTLTENDAAVLVNILGQLPTNSGVYPLLVQLVQQFNAQKTPPPEAS